MIMKKFNCIRMSKSISSEIFGIDKIFVFGYTMDEAIEVRYVSGELDPSGMSLFFAQFSG